MCKILGISRQTYYYQPKYKKSEADLEEAVEEVFNQSRKNYDTRKIKRELEKRGIILSPRKISQIMKRRHLVSTYTKTKFKPTKTSVNEAKIVSANFPTESP